MAKVNDMDRGMEDGVIDPPQFLEWMLCNLQHLSMLRGVMSDPTSLEDHILFEELMATREALLEAIEDNHSSLGFNRGEEEKIEMRERAVESYLSRARCRKCERDNGGCKELPDCSEKWRFVPTGLKSLE